MAVLLAAPVSAQFAGSIALQSDYRDRGYSISGDDPAANLNLSYDYASGVYLDSSIIADIGDGSPKPLGAIGGVGYARRVGQRVSLDVGYAHTQYFHYADARGDGRYDEVYAGISAYGLSAHVYASPDYYQPAVWALYGELDGTVRPVGEWRLIAHVGVLNRLSRPQVPEPDRAFDWRIAVSRPIRHFDIQVGLTGAGPRDDEQARSRGRVGPVGLISWSF